jgi:hypothetical protein
VRVLLCGLALGGCERRSAEPRAVIRVPVDVLADSSLATLTPFFPHPRARVRPGRVRPARPLAQGPALPDALPDTSLPEAPPVAARADDRLEPPILRTPGRLVLPAPSARAIRSRVLWIDLDLRVDETGAVTQANWAGGLGDSAFVAAARRWALGMRFYPALRRGEPVAVWCRQRLEVSRSE